MHINTSNNNLGLGYLKASQAESKKANSNKQKSLSPLSLAVAGITTAVGISNISPKMALPEFPSRDSNSTNTCRVIASEKIEEPLTGLEITSTDTKESCQNKAKEAFYQFCEQKDSNWTFQQVTGFHNEAEIYQEKCHQEPKIPSN